MHGLLFVAMTFVLSAGAEEAKAPPRTGDFKDEFKDSATGAGIKYRLRAPKELPKRNHLGLILCFHGLNGNEDSVTGFAIDAVSRNGLADQYLILRRGEIVKRGTQSEMDADELRSYLVA